jgi:signal transduction histidine kinase
VTTPLSAQDRERFADDLTDLAVASRMEHANALMREGKIDRAMKMAQAVLDDVHRLLERYKPPPDEGQ